MTLFTRRNALKLGLAGGALALATPSQALVEIVVTGGDFTPLPIAIPYKETFLALHAGGFMTHVGTIEVGGQSIQVLPKDYQLEPVRDFLMHVDFLRVSEKSRVTVEVPGAAAACSAV